MKSWKDHYTMVHPKYKVSRDALERHLERRKRTFNDEVARMLRGFGLKVTRKDKEKKNV